MEFRAMTRAPRAAAILAGGLALLGVTRAAADQGDGASAEREQQTLAAIEGPAVDILAARLEIDAAQLTVVGSSTADYPLQFMCGYGLKVLSELDGQIYGLLLDESGQELDAAALAARESAADLGGSGKLDVELAEQLAARTHDLPRAVMIFLATDDIPEPATDALELARTVEEQDAALSDYQSAWQEAYSQKAEPIVDFLGALGFAAKLDGLLPVIYTEVDPKMIEALAELPEVRLIQGSQAVQPELDVARREVNVHLLPVAYTGLNVVVGQVEVGGRVAVANPSLTHVVQDNTFVCAAPDNHSTTVAGAIGSRHAVHRGIAPGARLWASGSCAGMDAQLQDRSSAGVGGAGVNVLNLSWGADIGGAMSARERFFDALALNGRVLIVKSAGSTGLACGGTGRVSSPGNAYNLLTVGAFDDRANPIWSGETMLPCSAGLDPASLHGDREKPEVAAPGANIMTTSIAAPWLLQLSGTSAAAGIVSGSAALAIQRNVNLRTRPEALKSILMATAVHNIEGATRLSEFDGAGGIDAYRAYQVAGGAQGNWKHAAYTCASPAVLDFAVMPLVAGKRTRVVISWGVDPAYAQYAQQPNADLDLQILSPTGASVAISASWDNGYEICEFTPTVSGNFRLRVHKFRCDLSPRFLGAAWYRMP